MPVKKSKSKLIPVLVTTEHKGVFFGFAPEDTDFSAPNIALTECRNCIYWSASMQGVFGLATKGPDNSCKIGPVVSRVTLRGVTSVSDVEPDAAKNWGSIKWSI